jgi:hypothetical protein
MLDIVGNTRLLRAGVYLATRLVSVGEQPLDRAMVEAVLTDEQQRLRVTRCAGVAPRNTISACQPAKICQQ